MSLDKLVNFKKDQVVNTENLVKLGIVNKEDAQKHGVKILGGNKKPLPLQIEVPISKKAAEEVEKAGGKIINK